MQLFSSSILRFLKDWLAVKIHIYLLSFASSTELKEDFDHDLLALTRELNQGSSLCDQTKEAQNKKPLEDHVFIKVSLLKIKELED